MAEAQRRAPEPDEVTRPFWKACEQRMLVYQRCGACAHRWLPPSVVCPRCWRGNPEWVTARGEARVVSYAVYHRAYHPAFKQLVPYVVAMIELAEGPRLMSNIVGIAAEAVTVGMAVVLDFLEADGGLLPVFRPIGEGG